jgi:hypothetical protein
MSALRNRARAYARPDKRVTPRAASFARIAKVLRIRAAAYRRRAKTDDSKLPIFWHLKSSILRDVAAEFDNEAATLRAMR